MSSLPYLMLLAGATLVALAITWSAWRQRTLPGALALGWLSLAVAEWMVGYALELASPDFATKLWWAKLQYAGIVCVPVAWLVLTSRVAGDLARVSPLRGWRAPASTFFKYGAVATFMMPSEARLGAAYVSDDGRSFAGSLWSGRGRIAILAIPLLTLGLALTNDFHHLFWSSVKPPDGSGFPALSITYGPWFWVHAAFAYLLLLLGSVQLARVIRASPGLYRRQVVLLLLSACVPWIGNMLYLARISPLDPTPFAFVLSVLLLSCALLRFRFLQIVPHAQSAVVESLRDGVLVLDSERRIAAMNPAAEHIIGIAAGTAIGQPSKLALAAYPELLALLSDPTQPTAEISIGLPAGRTHYDAHCVPLSDSNGQLSGQVMMLHDVTQRKRAEDAHRFLASASTLLASSLDYEATLANVARLVVPFLADWCLVYLLGADQTLHCVTSLIADPAKQALADGLRRDDPLVTRSSSRVLQSGQSQLIAQVSDADIVDLAADAHQLKSVRAIGVRSLISVPLIVRGRLLGTLVLASSDSGRVYGSHNLALAEDLAARMALAVDNARLIEELRASDRSKSEFLAHMSHEIRTPLSGVLGMIDLLLETDLAIEQRDFIEKIRTGGNALLAIVNGILDFSKIEAGKLELEQAPFDLPACVEEAIDMVAIMAADRSLDLACIFDPATPARLIGDATRLRQVLVNLLSNAIKFTHQGDVFVAVDAQPLDDAQLQLRFSIADTGVGIPAERIQDIFTPFSQLGAATYRRYGGTGLGLVISRRLVDLMGGQIQVESQPGAGSTFTFTIRAAAAPDTPTAVQPMPDLAGRRVLIVDEHRRSRQALIAYAEAWGMLPCAAASAIEALTWIRQGQLFDVAIVDMLNSDMSGLMLASEIRRYRAARTLPLILVDMLGRPDLSPGSAESDYQVVLHKPLKLLQLQAALVNSFEGRLFHTSLPAKRADGHWPVNEPAPRILLAEDDTINQQVILHMLQQLGYQSQVVRDGDLALEAIEQRRYDVVLLDVQMPSRDGLEVAQAIRQRYPPERQPYLVAITANAMEGVREECLSAGMDDYISKPIQVAELMKVIEMHRLRARSDAAAEAPPAAFQVEQPMEQERIVGGAVDSVETLLPGNQPFADAPTWRLADLIERFLDDTADLLNIMGSAVALGDVRAIQRAAHRLKSSSALVGAMMLSELCDQIERAIRMNTPIDLQAQVERIEIEFARVKSSLSA